MKHCSYWSRIGPEGGCLGMTNAGSRLKWDCDNCPRRYKK